MKIAVIGCGTWGTAFARLMANEGNQVLLVCRGAEQADAINSFHRNPRYLFDIALPDERGRRQRRQRRSERRGCGGDRGSQPSVFGGDRGHRGAHGARCRTAVDDQGTGSVVGQAVVGDRLGAARGRRLAVLSGPNHAEEVAHDFPMAAVVAAADIDLARELQAAISSRLLRVYASSDVVGVELCGAAKNVIGLTAGIRRAGIWRQRQGGHHHPRHGRDVPPGDGLRRRSQDVLGNGRDGRPGGHLHVTAFPQPPGRRAACPGSARRLDRVRDRPGGRGTHDRAGTP